MIYFTKKIIFFRIYKKSVLIIIYILCKKINDSIAVFGNNLLS